MALILCVFQQVLSVNLGKETRLSDSVWIFVVASAIFMVVRTIRIVRALRLRPALVQPCRPYFYSNSVNICCGPRPKSCRFELISFSSFPKLKWAMTNARMAIKTVAPRTSAILRKTSH